MGNGEYTITFDTGRKIILNDAEIKQLNDYKEVVDEKTKSLFS